MKDLVRIAAVADIHVSNNVAMPLLAARFADRPPFRVIEVPVREPVVA